jgi:RNA polymerase-binding transcription factor DksA
MTGTARTQVNDDGTGRARRAGASGAPPNGARQDVPVTEPSPGTALSPAEHAALQERLTAEHANATAQIADLTRDLQGVIAASADSNADDEHDPEGQTIAFERAQVAALLSRGRERLADLDRALTQLHDGSYGICERCGQPIAPERLAARPAARTCITCAAARRR